MVKEAIDVNVGQWSKKRGLRSSIGRPRKAKAPQKLILPFQVESHIIEPGILC